MFNQNLSRKIPASFNFFLCLLTSLSAIAFGAIPQVNWQEKNIVWENQVVAQSDTDLRNYAKAAQEIENLRQSTFRQIEQKVGKDKASRLACNQAGSLNQLPDDARSLAQNYCNQSEAIVKKHNLTINQFNDITQQRKTDPNLNQKIQEMISP